MRLTSLAWLLSGLLFSVTFNGTFAQADPFTDRCPDIQACAKVVGELLGQKYIFDTEVKGSVVTGGTVEFTRDNAELLFTNMLHLNGYSRVPMGAPLTYQILKERDARDTNVPSFSADAKRPPQLPNTWDIVNLKYKATHAESVEMIARVLRSFLPATARIIPSDLSGMLIITAAAPDAKKAYELIVENDQAPSAALKKRWEDQDKVQRLEATQKAPEQIPPHKPEKHQVTKRN